MGNARKWGGTSSTYKSTSGIYFLSLDLFSFLLLFVDQQNLFLLILFIPPVAQTHAAGTRSGLDLFFFDGTASWLRDTNEWNSLRSSSGRLVAVSSYHCC
ncbi:uncharacterized protein GGS25DRAFT_366476 [Hypoxylon fragiforme]|uniref:uncharacterized protein n=1 Tax=Hypoxylon fragiforme TaxID=63214 RepID=UPI0020C5EF04|nr:uncharacterized protein GGS25DRAFT_366476 [Hypoxylon fragiforme]KAI2605965.1 hypothetical protein GGS25DRAFT_366476 [Hypoxylon fragiforme]